MQSPRGSNDRLNEANTDRDNAQRLFDSQNNAKGGYCWGPTMTYYESSYLQLEWTTQHGCGVSQNNVDCDFIVQYMCDPNLRDGDGSTTDTITQATMSSVDANGIFIYGQHEPYSYYQACASRSRNQGLFTADQGNLGTGATATQTRQNNGGTTYGFECQEERDYYPYWHPSPWKDIVIFTSNTARCPYFQQNSQNVMDKYWCYSDATDSANVEQYDTATKCGAQYWTKVAAWNIPAPLCFPAGWNRDNHLGNGLGGYTNSYKWIIPTMAEIGQTNWITDPRPNTNNRKVAPCAVRFRYNISSGDYRGGVENTGIGYTNGGYADYTMNGAANSPVTQNPYVQYGTPSNSADQTWTLRLNIDTSQFCRTFQDRSFMFYVTAQPVGHVGPIYNLGVRGKRGNIVQTYPATEYDFTPNTLNINIGDFIHFQWTGCDTNPTGNDGTGIQGTDRSNFVLLNPSTQGNGRTNYPKPFNQVDVWGYTGSAMAQDLTFKMAYINQYNNAQCTSQTDTNCCFTQAQLTAIYSQTGDATQDPQNCGVLNAPGANYFDAGLVQMSTSGTYNYMSTRNNAFTNRSQKGAVTITAALSTTALVATVVGSAGFSVAAVISGGSWYASAHPESCVANVFQNIKA
jgi:hypothetical protein